MEPQRPNESNQARTRRVRGVADPSKLDSDIFETYWGVQVLVGLVGVPLWQRCSDTWIYPGNGGPTPGGAPRE